MTKHERNDCFNAINVLLTKNVRSYELGQKHTFAAIEKIQNPVTCKTNILSDKSPGHFLPFLIIFF